MPNSYIFMGLLAVVCIILSLKWMKNSTIKEKEYREQQDAAEWAMKWNEQWGKEDSHKWCDDICLHCEENDWCKFSEVK